MLVSRSKFHDRLPPRDMNSTCIVSKTGSVAPNVVPHSNSTKPMRLKRRDNEEEPQWRRPCAGLWKGVSPPLRGGIHLKENQVSNLSCKPLISDMPPWNRWIALFVWGYLYFSGLWKNIPMKTGSCGSLLKLWVHRFVTEKNLRAEKSSQANHLEPKLFDFWAFNMLFFFWRVVRKSDCLKEKIVLIRNWWLLASFLVYIQIPWPKGSLFQWWSP